MCYGTYGGKLSQVKLLEAIAAGGEDVLKEQEKPLGEMCDKFDEAVDVLVELVITKFDKARVRTGMGCPTI